MEHNRHDPPEGSAAGRGGSQGILRHGRPDDPVEVVSRGKSYQEMLDEDDRRTHRILEGD